LLDANDPETAIRLEVEEETGYRVSNVRRVFELFMSPGSVTERIYFFVAEYSADDRINAGGGLIADGEDIGVLELDFDRACAMMHTGEIADGKTVILLQYALINRLLD
jgi:nudix-type nucleoside diphosphatase (YffH/AdpP family)